ncbi:MAG: GDSL-type esterase/lipase family protein [Bosea sp. (in: a-proteobacteria)]
MLSSAQAENHSPAEVCLSAAASPRIGASLPKSAAKLVERRATNTQTTLRILALGSSSTRGVGASSWAATYPEVMQREIERLRPQLSIEIINQGRNGETIPGQLARISSEVIPARPDIVIWQLGANDVVMPWGGLGADFAEQITAGIRQMQGAGADVILMDLQRTPMVMWSSGREALIALVANAAKATGAGHFRRHELFAKAEAAGASASDFTSWDGLHNNDAGYDCTGRALARAIHAAWGAAARKPASKPARRSELPQSETFQLGLSHELGEMQALAQGTKAAAAPPAPPEIYLMRGQYDVFSNGINDMGRALRRNGRFAVSRSHHEWRKLGGQILARRKAGAQRGPLVLIGHSLGGNNALALAAWLGQAGVRVSLVITIDPTVPPAVPANVSKVVNYYLSADGWGVPVRAAQGFRGELINADLSAGRRDLADDGTTHYTIDDAPRVQADIFRLINAAR